MGCSGHATPNNSGNENVAKVSAGVKVIVAFADTAVLATPVAVTTTFCCEFTEAGAVYIPELEIEPVCGVIDHMTDVLEVPVTVA
jgi:hypothetical protein